MKLSSIFNRFKQCIQMKNISTFWFGGILALLNQNIHLQQNFIEKDLTPNQFCELIKIINHTLVDAIDFYPEQPTDDFYRFLQFCQQILSEDVNQSIIEKQHDNDYNFVLAKSTLKNTLIIHSLHSKQYSYAFNLCKQLNKDVKKYKIDMLNEVYLAFFSNYLTILKRLTPTRRNIQDFNNLIKEIQQNLAFLFMKLIQKMSRSLKTNIIDSGLLQVLVLVFKKHQNILKPNNEYFENLVISIFRKDNTKSQNSLSLSVNGAKIISKIYRDRIQKQLFLSFNISEFQFNHYFQVQRQSKSPRRLLKRVPSTRDIDQRDYDESKKLIKIEKMLQKSINLLSERQQDHFSTNKGVITNRFRRLSHISQTQRKPTLLDLSKTIEVSGFQSHQLIYDNDIRQNQALIISSNSKKFTIRHQVTSEMISPTKNNNKSTTYNQNFQPKKSIINNNNSILFHPKQIGSQISKDLTHHSINFKIGSIFIQTNNDGILLSDYTKQNKRYIEWNTVSLILSKLQYRFLYQEYLKFSMFNQYDLIRILKYYLSKNQNGNIAVFEYPNVMLELNEFVRFYPQDGKYTKLVLMNIYDTSKIEGNIDCYFQQFQHFFKKISSNGYINYLNQKVLNDLETDVHRNQVFCLQMLRKKQPTTKSQLQQQFNVSSLDQILNEKSCCHKALFILKSNCKVCVKIKISEDGKQSSSYSNQTNSINSTFFITVKRLPCQQQQLQQLQKKSTNPSVIMERTIEIPMSKMLNYFPQYDMDLSTYFKRYGRMIFEFFNNFEDLYNDQNMSSLNFQIISHTFLTEMIQIGKYFTMASAQLIGTKNQITALIVRYNFLPANKDVITLLVNPYVGFLSQMTTMKSEQKRTLLKKLLINQSVKDTYYYLQKSKKLNQINSLIQYISEGLGLV